MNMIQSEIKRIASSQKMFALVILSTIIAGLNISSNFVDSNGMTGSPINLLGIAICVGLWMVYLNAKNDSQLETKGYTVLKVVYNIKTTLVLIAIIAVLVACTIVAVLSNNIVDEISNRKDDIIEFIEENNSNAFEVNGITKEEFDDALTEFLDSEEAGTLIVAMAWGFAIGFILVFIFLLLYVMKMAKMLKGIRSNIIDGNKVNTYSSGYLSFIFIVCALINGLGALTSLGSGIVMAGVISGCQCAAYVLVYLIFREYKDNAFRISYHQPEAYMPTGYGDNNANSVYKDTTNDYVAPENDYKAPEDDNKYE